MRCRVAGISVALTRSTHPAVRQPRCANQTFILEQRAYMRERLVQVAIAGKLTFSAASLAGFAQPGAQSVVETILIDDSDSDGVVEVPAVTG